MTKKASGNLRIKKSMIDFDTRTVCWRAEVLILRLA